MYEAFDPDCAVVAFRTDSNPLSNYYKYTITNSDTKHKSAEDFYQYELCLHCDRPGIAKQVYDAPSPKAAKQISAKIKTCVSEDVLDSWDNIKLTRINGTRATILDNLSCVQKAQQSLMLHKIYSGGWSSSKSGTIH